MKSTLLTKGFSPSMLPALVAALFLCLSVVTAGHVAAANDTQTIVTVLPDGTELSTCINGADDREHRHGADHCPLCTLTKGFALATQDQSLVVSLVQSGSLGLKRHDVFAGFSGHSSAQPRAPPSSI